MTAMCPIATAPIQENVMERLLNLIRAVSCVREFAQLPDDQRRKDFARPEFGQWEYRQSLARIWLFKACPIQLRAALAGLEGWR